MVAEVHPSSVISKDCELDTDVYVGPYCVVRGRVRIGKGTRLESHVCVGSDFGTVHLGENNRISPGVSLGGDPQDRSYKNEPTRLLIGDGNQIREYVSISRGTVKGGGDTVIGNNNMIMAYCHFGHDNHIGNENTFANSSQFAGHVVVDDRVTVGGMCAFNQHTHVGSFAFIGGYSAVNRDILPFTIAQGNYAISRATNKIGLERSKVIDPAEIENIHKAVRIIIKGSSTISEGLIRIAEECKPSPEIDYFVSFIKKSKRGVAK